MLTASNAVQLATITTNHLATSARRMLGLSVLRAGYVQGRAVLYALLTLEERFLAKKRPADVDDNPPPPQ